MKPDSSTLVSSLFLEPRGVHVVHKIGGHIFIDVQLVQNVLLLTEKKKTGRERVVV